VDFSEWDFDFGPKSELLRDHSYFQKVSVPEAYPTFESRRRGQARQCDGISSKRVERILEPMEKT